MPVAGDLLDAVLDASASLILVIDAAGNVVRLNRACERLLGYGADELEGEAPCSTCCRKEERPIAAGVLERLTRPVSRPSWGSSTGARVRASSA